MNNEIKERYLESESLSHLTYLLNCLKTNERWKDYTTEFYFNADTSAWHVDFTVEESNPLPQNMYHWALKELKNMYEVIEAPSSFIVVNVSDDEPCKVAVKLYSPTKYLVQLMEEPFQDVSSFLLTSDWKEVEERLLLYRTLSSVNKMKGIFNSNDYELVKGWDEDIQEFKKIVSKDKLNEVMKTVLEESPML